MIITPDEFLPAVDIELADDVIAHVFCGDRLVLHAEDAVARPWRFYRELGLDASRITAIGHRGSQAHAAVSLSDSPDFTVPAPLKTAGLRAWFGVMADDALSIAMRGVQLLEWDRSHRFCGACSTPTQHVSGERARRCPACGLSAYPRISPAMMVLVTRGQQLLLGRGLNFPPGRYSALAGFLEAGETIEQAVVREVREEVGVEIEQLRYFGSQSWPFPNSLMIAFRAEWASGDIRVDPAELADAGWFEPDQLPDLPPRISISRALIEATLKELRNR
ncbi:MAG: pyrophosphatase [Pseudomonadota bacterium]|jgi:NAD+ diphosphatase